MVKCFICNGLNFTTIISDCIDYEYGVRYNAKLIECGNCGLCVIDPKPSFTDLHGFYKNNYANYSSSKNYITKLLVWLYQKKNAAEVIDLIGKEGKILDVGCADGQYFDLLKNKGNWDLFGTDLSQQAADNAKEKGYEVYIGELERLDLQENYFNIVRMNHVIEHVIEPKATFDKIKKILKPGGYLILETPNVSCPDFKIFKRYWGALHFPRHIHLFSNSNIEIFIKNSGMVLKKVEHTLMTTGWALGIQNILINKYRIKSINGRILIYPFLLIGFIPVLFLQRIFKQSTMVKYVIQKA